MQKKKSLKGYEKLIYFINVLVSLALLISYLLPYISPEKAPKISVLSLLFPILFFINLLFFTYWLLKGKRQLVLSLLILVVGYQHLTSLFKLSEKEILLNDDIKVMSYNVKMFNYYQWNEDDSLAMKTYDFIKQKNPDILILQEFYDDNQSTLSYPHKFVKMKSKTNKFGLAIYSKFPIINSGSLDFEFSANNTIFCDILIEKDTVRVYNVHLESLKVNPNKENFGEENSEKLVGRLASTFKKQAKQVAIFKKHEENWKGKKIISGDFNNTAFSWVYHEIKGDKNDSFEEAGKGFGKTFDYTFPLRIDFIFPDSTFEVNNFKTFKVKFSDHYPIMARLDL